MATIAGPPKQDRSRDSLERLLSAGLEMLEEDGLEGFTIAAVAKRAGIGIGLVYRRFEDKNALLAGHFERFAQQTSADLQPAIRELESADATLEEMLPEFTMLVAAMFRRRERLTRAFVYANRGDTSLAAAVEEGIRPMATQMQDLLLAHRDEFRCADPELAVAFCYQQMVNAFTALLTSTNRVHAEIGWETSIDQLSLMTLAHLTRDPLTS